jgi:hypothetical protein
LFDNKQVCLQAGSNYYNSHKLRRLKAGKTSYLSAFPTILENN